MTFCCVKCGYATNADFYYEVIRQDIRFFDLDDLESNGVCAECRKEVTARGFEKRSRQYGLKKFPNNRKDSN